MLEMVIFMTKHSNSLFCSILSECDFFQYFEGQVIKPNILTLVLNVWLEIKCLLETKRT